jgi:hypothetical protein
MSQYLCAIIVVMGADAMVICVHAADNHNLEEPAVFSAQGIWGDQAKTAHAYLQEDVTSDGLYRHYHFVTDAGSYDIVGDQLMAVRLYENRVYEQLKDDSGFAQFFRSFGSSAIAPLKFGGQLITSPIETVKNSANGIGNFFDSMSASSENKNPDRESFMGGVLGTDTARREIATQFDVDPYTDFPPLASRLHDLAAASGIGGLSLRGVMVAIPGGAALPTVTATTTRTMVFTASSVGTAQALKESLRTKTAGQIVRDSRAILAAVVRRASVVNEFLDNNNYTPADMLVMAAAFEKIHTQDAGLLLAQCAAVKDRTHAFLCRLQAEMYAGLKNSLPFDRFVTRGSFVIMQLRDHRYLWAMPADIYMWTADNEADVAILTHALAEGRAPEPAQKNGKTTPVKPNLLVITGDYSALASKQLSKLKWEPARMTLVSASSHAQQSSSNQPQTDTTSK